MLEDAQAVYAPRPRHGVVHEAARQELPGVVVHRHFVEHLPGALREAALHLTFDNLVVDDVARVIAGDIRHDVGFAGLRRDLHLGDVTAVWEARAELVRVREIHLSGVLRRQLLNRYAAVGALDAVLAAGDFDIGLRRLEVFRGERQSFFHQLVRAEKDHAADGEQGARAAGGIADEVELRPRGAQPDFLHGDAEHTGDELRIGRLVPLTVVVRRRVQRERAVAAPAHLDLVLRREAGASRLDVGRHAAAAQPAAPLRFTSPALKPVPVRRRERLVHHALEVAGVVLEAGGDVVRK